MSDGRTLSDIEQLIAEFKQSGLREMHARCGDFEIYLSMDSDAPGLDGGRTVAVAEHRPAAAKAAPAAAAAPVAAAPAAAAAPEVPEGAVVIPAPYLGTFYRSPKPGSDPYVEVGSEVGPDSELCLVEVMKLFTAVRAGVSGRIVQVYARDGELVSEGQPLFAVMPA